jgi:cell filamentation protein
VYASTPDPYCYPGTPVLKNRANLRDQVTLDAYEHEAMMQRAEEGYPAGRLSVSHFKALHKHLFQDVYFWAGRFRTVRISKGSSSFCYPEHIDAEMRRLFAGLQQDDYFGGLTAAEFAARAAHFLAELNAIHPFREGNGRTQLTYLTLLSEKAGHPINVDLIEPATILQAIIASFAGNEALLAEVLRGLMR